MKDRITPPQKLALKCAAREVVQFRLDRRMRYRCHTHPSIKHITIHSLLMRGLCKQSRDVTTGVSILQTTAEGMAMLDPGWEVQPRWLR